MTAVIYATDPGLRRLSTAVRATVTWIFVVAVVLVVCLLTGADPAYAFPGMLVVSAATMSLTMNLDDRLRIVALVAGSVSAAAAVILGTLVDGDPLLQSLVFLALGVGALGAFVLGSAAVVAALAAIVAYYATSLIGARWDTLAGNITSAVWGALASAVLLGVLLRERPAIAARRLVRSISAACARLTSATPRQRERRLDQLLDAVTASRAHMALYPEVWPTSWRADDAAIFAAATTPLDQPNGWCAQLPTPIWPSGATHVRTRVAVEPHDPGGRGVVSTGLQLLTATAVSLVAAQLIDPRYWFWCVLAALVMLFGTTSAADAIGKGLRRVIGTGLALPLGVVLSHLMHGDLLLIAGFVLLTMFLQQYLADIAYGASVFFLTLLLSALVSATGSDTTTALEARLLLTAVGAGIGILVALLVLPTRTGPLLRGRAVAVVDAACDTLSAVRERAPAADVVHLTETTERRLALLRREAAAARSGWPFSARHERILYQLSAGDLAAQALRNVTTLYRSGATVTPAAEGEIDRTLELLRQARHRLTRASVSSSPVYPRPTPVIGRADDPFEVTLTTARTSLQSLVVQLVS